MLIGLQKKDHLAELGFHFHSNQAVRIQQMLQGANISPAEIFTPDGPRPHISVLSKSDMPLHEGAQTEDDNLEDDTFQFHTGDDDDLAAIEDPYWFDNYYDQNEVLHWPNEEFAANKALLDAHDSTYLDLVPLWQKFKNKKVAFKSFLKLKGLFEEESPSHL